MAKLQINVSGRRGLLERHQGDLNDNSAQQNLRYVGEDGQFAEGYFNPMKVFGYLNPANNKYTTLTGTIGSPINSIQYDASGNIVYLSEGGENILKLDGLSDTSLSNYLTLTTSTFDIKDMIIYEMSGSKSLLYLVDTNVYATGSYVGFKSLDTTKGAALYSFTLQNVLANMTSYQLNDSSGTSLKVAQSFNSSSLTSLYVTGVRLKMAQKNISPAVNFTVSIQSDNSASTSPYTSKGAWAGGTNYVINDTVTDGGYTWHCYLAHNSTTYAGSEPGVGGNWRDVWIPFGSPNGTPIATKTLSSSTLAAGNDNELYQDVYVEFTTPVTLTAATNYWIVIEQSGLTAGQYFLFNASGNQFNGTNLPTNTGGTVGLKYLLNAAVDYWVEESLPNRRTHYLDYSILCNRIDDWSNTVANGKFYSTTGQNSFLYLADNALVYWFAGNKVHTLDGGITGGYAGRINQEVLSFPSYLTVPDVAETRSRMYIGVQGSNITSTTDPRVYTPNTCGVYVWDRRSQVVGGGDFYEASGAKEIKKVFKSSDGTIKLITVGNSGFSEIRGITGNQFGVIHTFEKDGYPVARRSVSQIDDMTVWFGANGTLYGYGSIAPGEPEQLYKLGTMAGEYTGTLTAGPIMVGHEEATEPRTGVFLAWSATGGSAIKLQKWYPHGDGTIDSLAQIAHVGNIYTKVYEFGSPLNMQWAHVMFLPINGGTSTQTVATIKVYYNKSTTVGSTFTIKRKDLTKGYFYMPLGEKNIFAIQFKIEYDVTQTLGTYDFMPSAITVEYDETKTKKK